MKYYSLSDYNKKQILTAQEKVANDHIQLTKAIIEENDYNFLKTEKDKEEYLQKGISYAEQIREGQHNSNFTVLQLLLLELTGKCIPLLP